MIKYWFNIRIWKWFKIEENDKFNNNNKHLLENDKCKNINSKFSITDITLKCIWYDKKRNY